jgi:hypothetical protein
MIPRSQNKRELKKGKVKQPEPEKPDDKPLQVLVVSYTTEIVSGEVSDTLNNMGMGSIGYTTHRNVADDMDEHYDVAIINSDYGEGWKSLTKIREISKDITIIYAARPDFDGYSTSLLQRYDAIVAKGWSNLPKKIIEAHAQCIDKRNKKK